MLIGFPPKPVSLFPGICWCPDISPAKRVAPVGFFGPDHPKMVRPFAFLASRIRESSLLGDDYGH